MLGMVNRMDGALQTLRRPSRFQIARQPPLAQERIAFPPRGPLQVGPYIPQPEQPDAVNYHRQMAAERLARIRATETPQGPPIERALEAEEFFTDYFDYVLDFVAENGASIGIGATVQFSINTEQASDFLWVKTMHVLRGTSPTATIRMFDEATNRSLSNRAMDITNWAGTAQNPAILPAKRVVPANSTLFFELTNTSAAELTAAEIVLGGYKKYYPSRLNLTAGSQACR